MSSKVKKPNYQMRSRALLNIFLIFVIILLCNLISSYFHYNIDLTEEKRYTLTNATTKLVEDLNDDIYVEVLLDGELPAGFKRLEDATKDLLDQFRSLNPKIQYRFYDPIEGLEVKEKNKVIENLYEKGIKPTTLKVKSNNEQSEKLIYPVAIVKFGSQAIIVNLLENTGMARNDEVVLNNSINLLEYKFADAISKIFRKVKPTIALTIGYGESKSIETQDLINALAPFYDVRRINLDSIYKVPDDIKLLIVSDPQFTYKEKAKFVLDQYIMNGGKMMFAINRLKIDMDSFRTKNQYFVPIENNTGLDDLLFKYGVRIQPNLILDLECTRIPLRVGTVNNQPQFDLFKWYYSPLLASKNNHVIVKNIDRVNFNFCSTIDTIRTKTPITKTILLSSSKYSRLQFAPMRLNFEILRYPPDPSKFDKPFQPSAVLLEGSFTSLYENRVGGDMLKTLEHIKSPFVAQGKPSKILVVSYGKLFTNPYKIDKEEFMPIGYNTFEQTIFGNRDFVLNAIEYMFDEKGILNARAKEVKLRLLDNVKIKEDKFSWQALNLIIPIGLITIVSFGFVIYRKRKFAK